MKIIAAKYDGYCEYFKIYETTTDKIKYVNSILSVMSNKFKFKLTKVQAATSDKVKLDLYSNCCEIKHP